MSSPFSPSFLKGEARAEQFLPGAFRQGATRLRWLQERRERRPAAGVLKALEDQARLRPGGEAVKKNLAALAEPGTLAVVTGQQVALFLGPLYSFYKAASAIAAARELERETGIRCVPVFWLQTEDHDYDEIQRCQVLSAEGTILNLSLPDDVGCDQVRTSVRHRRLDASIELQLEQLTTQLGALPHADVFLNLLRAHYRPGVSLADAFAGVMGSLFGAEGLLLLDPRDAALAAIAAPVHARALMGALEISDILRVREQALKAAGFDVQVHVRPGSPLFFYHPDGAEGPRYRLDPAGSQWTLAGSERTVSSAELQRDLARDPLRFSTSALLRPILQDYLLPVAAYVAGPGEINYLAQTSPLSQWMKVPPAMVIPRARFRLLEPRTRSLLEMLHLTPSDVECPREELHPSSHSEVEQRLMGNVRSSLDALEKEAAQLHLSDALATTRATMERAASRFAGRYQRRLAEKDRVSSERLDRLRMHLYPEGMPQERFHSLPYFACKYGVDTLKSLIFSKLTPFSGELENLSL